MAGRIAAALELTTERRQDLTALSRAHSTPQKLAERARFIFEAFIAYFNETMAKPFRWTFSGKPLAA